MSSRPIRTTLRHPPDGNGITRVEVIDHGHVAFATDRDPVIAEVVAEARARELRRAAGEDVTDLPMMEPGDDW